MEPADNSLETPDQSYDTSPYNSSLEGPEVTIQPSQVPDTGPKSPLSLFRLNRLALTITGVAVVAIVLIGVAAVLLNTLHHSAKNSAQAGGSDNYAVSSLSLGDLKPSDQLEVGQADYLAINGQLRANNTLVLTPTAQPANGTLGQFYFDEITKQPYYYDGSQFVAIGHSIGEFVSSLGGQSGNIGLGEGLVMNNGQLSLSSTVLQASRNSGKVVTSVNGQTGDVTLAAGSGIGISGTTITNTGVTSLTGTPNQVNVSSSTGNVTLSLPQDIATISSPTFASLQLNGNLVLSAGNSIADDTTNGLTFNVNGRSFVFPAAGPANQTICTTGVTCASGAGSAVILAPGSAQNNGSGNSAIFINNTAGGDLLQLQGNGADVFVVDANGNLTATSISGNGAGLTALNASNINTGTLADARLSGNVALLNANNNFTGASLQHNGNNICDTSGNCSGVGGGVTTSGGTSGTIPVFTGSQSIGDSIITQSGGNINISGGLSANTLSGNGAAVTNVDAITLQGHAANFFTNASNLSSGTLADARLSANVTLQGNTFNGANQLVQLNGTGGLPALNGSLLTSLNASNIASGTLADARLSANVALLNGNNNFTGVTLQHNGNDVCDTSGNCTSAGAAGGDLTGTYPNPTIAKLQGVPFSITSLTAGQILQYNGTDWINNTVSGDITLSTSGVATIGNGVVTNVKLANSSLTVTAGNGLSGGGSVALGGSTTLNVVYGSAANTAVQGSTTLVCPNGTGNLTGGGNTVTLGSGGSCNNLTVVNSPTFSGNLTVQGASGVTIGVAGTTAGVLNLANSTNSQLSILQSQAPSGGGNVTYNLPTAAGGSTQTICTVETGNCAGSGTGITGSGTPGAIAKFNSSNSLTSSSLSESGTTLTASGNLIIQGANALALGSSATTDGSIAFYDAAGTHTVTLQAPATDPTANIAFKLPSADGGNGSCLETDGSGNLSFQPCTGGAGGGVTSLNGQTGVVNLANATGSSGTVTINNASTSQKGIAQFNATNFTASSGTINTIQDIATTSSPTFANLTATSTVAIQGSNALTLGTTGTNTGAILFKGSTAASGTITLIGPANPSNNTLTLPNETGTLCSTGSICSGYQSALAFNNGLTNTAGTVQLGGSFIQNTTLAAGNSFGLSLTSDLSGGARSSYPLSITQANNASNNNSVGLLQLSNSDTGSTAALLNIDQQAGAGIGINFTQNSGTGINFTQNFGTSILLNTTGGTGIQFNNNVGQGGGGTGINFASVTGSGIGISIADPTLTNGIGLSIGGNISSSLLNGFSGNHIQVNTARTSTATSGTVTDSGNFLNLTRSTVQNGAGGTFAVTGALATLQSNCTQTAGTCTDTSNILNLNQQYANATGAVALIQNAGTGNALQIQDGSGNINGKFNATGNQLTLGRIANSGTVTAGSLTLADGTTDNFGNTLNTTTLTASRTITLPDATGTVCLQNAVACGFALNAGGGMAFVQGGNSFGATAVLGTNDNNGLNIRTNGTTVASLSNTGAAVFENASNSSTAFQVQNATGNAMLTVDTTGNGNIKVGNATNPATISFVGGATANRPASPTAGQLYFDTSTNQLLQYNGSKWVSDARNSTKIVAASNSSQAEKDAADYVATGSGDQATINTALTAAAGGSVYLMEGTYTLSAAISIPNNTTLAGAGAGTVLTIPNAQNGTYNMVTNTDTSNGTNVTVRDLLIDGNKANQSSGNMHGIYFNGVGNGSGATARDGGKVSAATVKNLRGNGIRLDNSQNGLITGDTLKANTGFGIYIASLNTTVSNNIAQGNGSDGIFLFGASNNTVTGNLTQGNTFYGIELNSAANNTITGNTTQSNSYGIEVSSSSNGNTFTGNLALSNTTAGIHISSSYNTITGNTVQGNSSQGISLTSPSTNNLVASNKIHDNGGTNFNNGVSLASASNNEVTDNDITDTVCSFNCYAITIDASSNSNYLSNNHYSGDGTNTASIHDLSTSTIYANQHDSSGNLINKSQGGGFTVGASSATASLTLQGGLLATALPAPTLSSTVTNVGTAGGTTYRYQVTALDGSGETTGSTIQQTTTGNATLSGTNYNTITWAPVGGAVQYNIYRCSGAACTPLKLATVNGNVTSYNDQAAGSPSGSAPASNTTGGAIIQGSSGLTLGIIAGSGTVTQGKLVFADGTTDNFGSTLNTTTLTANRTISLPDASGTICLQSSAACGFALSAGGGTAFVQGGNSFGAQAVLGTNDNNSLAFRTNSTNRLILDTSGNLTFQQASAIAPVAVGGATAGNNLTLNGGAAASGTGGTLALKGGNASASNGGDVTIAGGNTVVNQAGNVTITGGTMTGNGLGDGSVNITGGSDTVGTSLAGNVNINAGNDGAADYGSINIGTTSSGNVSIGNAVAGFGVTSIQARGGINIDTGNAANTLQLGNIANGIAQTINIGNNATAGSTDTVTIGNLLGGSTTTIQAGTGNLNLTTNSASASIIAKSSTNSTTAFQVQNSSGIHVLSVDTTNGKAILGNVTSTAGQTLQGALTFADGTTDNFGSTLQTNTLTANRVLSLPNETGTLCSTGSVCAGYQSPLTFNNGLTNTAGTVQLGGSFIQNTTLAAGNSFGLTVTSDLSGGARSTYPLTISQANNASNDNSVGLLNLTNSDTASTAGLLNINQVSLGTAITISGAGSGTGIDATSITAGFVLNANGLAGGTVVGALGLTTGNVITSGGGVTTSGVGLQYNTTSTGLTTGSALKVSGLASGALSAYTGSLINVAPTRTLTSGSINDSGNFLNLTRSNTVNNAGSTFTVSGALANLQSNCTQTAGTCTDTSNILNLNQQYASATGAVLNVQNIGNGAGINLAQGAGTGINLATSIGIGIKVDSLTTGTGIEVANGSNLSTGAGINVNVNNLTSGSGIIIGGFSANAVAFTGQLLNINATKTATSSITDSGNFLRLLRSNTVNGAGQTFTITGALANLQSNCTQTAGTCTDTSNILNLNQQYANATGAVVNLQNAGTGNALQIQDGSANVNAIFNNVGNQLTLGRVASSGTVTQGKLLFADGTTDNFAATLNTTTLTANRTITIPDATGTICLQASAACGFATSASGAAAFVQGGNSFGATATLGTNDNNGLNIRTNSTTVASLSNTGAALFKNASDSTTAFQVQNAAGANLVTADTLNGIATLNGLGGGATTFAYTGSTQTFVVPTGVTSITVDLSSAGGGSGGGNTGGSGGRIRATIPVTAGHTLTMYVGGHGTNGGGNTGASDPGHAGGFGYGTGGSSGSGLFDGAGAGGGASAIFDTTSSTLLAIAGAGGGGGSNSNGGNGSGTGNGSAAGTNGTCQGAGATTSAVGAGGSCSGINGSAGSGNTGGAGGSGGSYPGGGGGGGLFGGGGGSGGAGTGATGGGGGGSGFIVGTATGVTNTDGYQASNGLVSVTYSGNTTVESLKVAGSGVTLSNTVNSSAAFQIQDSTGSSNLLVADTINGRVAIGGPTAGARLEVDAAASGIGQIIKANATSPGDLLQLQDSNANVLTKFTSNGSLVIGSTSASNTASALEVLDSVGAVAFNVSTNNVATGANAANATLKLAKDSGTGRSINAAGTINASGADFAEYYYQQQPGTLQPGQIVCLTASQTVDACGQSGVITGAVSATAGYVGNDIFDLTHPENTAVVGMLGQLSVQVSVSNGAIKAGDPIGLSGTAGIGAKQTGAGQIVGWAMEDASADGTIKVVVRPQYYTPTGGQNMQGNNPVFDSVTVNGAMNAQSINVGGLATLGSLHVTGSATFDGNLTVSGATKVMDITIAGHIITSGSTPQVSALTAAGTGATATITGNDTAGVITIVTGAQTTTGSLVSLNFAKAFGATPTVVLTPANAGATAIGYYYNATTGTFTVNAANLPVAGTTYIFSYHVIQ